MKYKIDPEELEFDFDGWAFVHFHTATPGHTFADSLNRLYNYRLARVGDMPIEGTPWPLYRHEDNLHNLIYFLVERPAAAGDMPWEGGDKVLIVRGETARSMAEHICADFADSTAIDEADLLAREHADIMADLLAGFTVASRLDFDSPLPSRKAEKERAQAMQLCDLILTHIEQKHLDLTREDLMRLEMKKLRRS